MDRLTKKYAGGYGLAKVKDNEQAIESSYPNTLRACFESWQRLGAYEDTGMMPDKIDAMKAELDALKADIEAGRLVRLPDELIAPYELNARYWVCGWDADDCTLVIQDRVLKSEALAAMEDTP